MIPSSIKRNIAHRECETNIMIMTKSGLERIISLESLPCKYENVTIAYDVFHYVRRHGYSKLMFVRLFLTFETNRIPHYFFNDINDMSKLG
jgi:hypothetical protein